MNAFAGFWVDGAVRKPEARHVDKEGCIIGRWKNDPDADFDLLLRRFDRWHEVYWLDTTHRESLTPEELWSVLKTLWPKCEAFFKPNDFDTAYWQANNRFHECDTRIDWGNLTQYPPPVEPQWIRITRENVGQYLFRECRFRDIEAQPWRVGKISGWDDQDGCCLVNSDFEEEMPIMQWCIVEVQA